VAVWWTECATSLGDEPEPPKGGPPDTQRLARSAA